MDEAAKEARRQYHREYAKNNRKRLNEAQKYANMMRDTGNERQKPGTKNSLGVKI